MFHVVHTIVLSREIISSAYGNYSTSTDSRFKSMLHVKLKINIFTLCYFIILVKNLPAHFTHHIKIIVDRMVTTVCLKNMENSNILRCIQNHIEIYIGR